MNPRALRLRRPRSEGPEVSRPDREVGRPPAGRRERRRRGTKNNVAQFACHPVRLGMAGKYLCVNLHIIWSTKNRRSFIDPSWRDRLDAYMGAVAAAKSAVLTEAQSLPDHTHIYVSLPSTISIADLVNTLKSNSSRWIRQSFPNRKWFAWQEGYAALSVSKSAEHGVREYIRNQDQHHRKVGFEDELIDLLERHGIIYDRRYVFD